MLMLPGAKAGCSLAQGIILHRWRSLGVPASFLRHEHSPWHAGCATTATLSRKPSCLGSANLQGAPDALQERMSEFFLDTIPKGDMDNYLLRSNVSHFYSPICF